MKKIISFIIICLSFLSINTQIIYADCPRSVPMQNITCYNCSDQSQNPNSVYTAGDCVPNRDGCQCIVYPNTNTNTTTSTTNIFGQIVNPLKSGALGTGPGAGLIALLNNVIRLVFVVAGIYTFIQILLAGGKFIGAGGDAKKIEQAWNTIWQSVLGLVIIVASIAIAALIGQLLFGDPTAILNPKIYGPGT